MHVRMPLENHTQWKWVKVFTSRLKLSVKGRIKRNHALMQGIVWKIFHLTIAQDILYRYTTIKHVDCTE